MTEVAFHFGAPDKAAYTCRLLRKAVASGAKVAVVADLEVCEQLDVDLWAVSAVEFVPHCQEAASDSVRRHSPVLLSCNQALIPATDGQILVQLLHSLPRHVTSFSRVIEVVSLVEEDRAMARERWRAYAAAGVSILRHDLALKG